MLFRLQVAIWLLLAGPALADEPFRSIPLQSRVTRVQPMTGIVLWTTNEKNRTDAIHLEYSYMKYGDIVKKKGEYDWTKMDRLLDEVAKRGHQAIIRFYYVYPGHETTTPAYIKALPDYKETRAKSEMKETSFCDWSHSELKRFTLEFYEKLAARYDKDPRLAFLETGFGLWAEYHIYDGPMRLGRTFPDKTFQAEFFKHLATTFKELPWLISIDAAEKERTPFAEKKDLQQLRFGLFDDSFLHKKHGEYNTACWNFFSRERWKTAPAGGEFSFYTTNDQQNALAKDGPNGVPFEKAAADFHITFMIGDNQLRFQKADRVRDAGMVCGYRFRILSFESNGKQSRVTVTNTGIAPIYHDAFVAVNGTRSKQSLKGLLPGEKKTFAIEAGGAKPVLTIESDRLVKGQRIQFDADVK